MLNVSRIRKDFPVLERKLNNKPIIYMDSACMSLKPIQVINAVNEYYRDFPACGVRSQHKLSKEVTERMIQTRKNVQKFINAKRPEEIVFTKNTTESINIIANGMELKNSKVLTSDREHNSNLLPWINLANKGIIKHDILKIKDEFNFEDLKKKIKGVKLLSLVHTSNLDGYSNPVKEIIEIAHDNDALVLLDCAQSVPHKRVDVRKLDADFIAFSGHKMLGPTGTGVLYGKYDLLKELKPFMLGGETVYNSTYTSYELEDVPSRFEYGLQNYSGFIGLNEAINYLNPIIDEIEGHEAKLSKIIFDGISNFADIVGIKSKGIVSFNIKGMDPHELAIMLDQTRNIMIRSGMHCVHSWFNAHKLAGSARVSLYLYNIEEEAKIFVEELNKIRKLV